MPLPIVIDVGVTDPPRELTTVLVEACSRAASETVCHLMREAPESPYAAIAIVTWEAPDRVRIEVGVRRETGAEWRSRQIAFQPADVELERYRSVGFVVGTLATTTSEEADQAPPPKPAEPEPKAPVPAPVLAPPPTQPKPPPPRVSRGFVGVAGTIGAGLSEGAPRFGGNLRAGIRVIERFAVLVSAGASTRVRDDQGLLLTWLDAGLGVGFAAGVPTKTHLELRLEFIGEHFTAGAVAGDLDESRERTIWAARPGIDGVLMLGSFVGLVAGIEATLRPSITYMRTESVDAGHTLVFEPGASLGVRVEL
jgi:hypothetical protein